MFTVKSIRTHVCYTTALNEAERVVVKDTIEEGTNADPCKVLPLLLITDGKPDTEIWIADNDDRRYVQKVFIVNSAGKTVDRYSVEDIS